MEEQINYIRLTADCDRQHHVFEALMYDYIDEMNEHSHRPLPKEFQKKWIDSIIAMQGPQDCHLELCCVDSETIGFLYGKIDREDHKGFIKPGYGYIMEFYVKPEYRRSAPEGIWPDRPGVSAPPEKIPAHNRHPAPVQ